MKTHERRTKIIATIGPALLKEGVLEKAITEVDALRFNFSHATPALADPIVKRIEQATTLENNVALIADLKGPEIRSDYHTHTLKKNSTCTFLCCSSEAKEKSKFTPGRIAIDHPKLHTLVKKNQIITADDGSIEFKVLSTSSSKITLKVLIGGTLNPNKTINVPGIDLKLPILDKKDKETLNYICKKRFNWIAASFVSHAKDVETIRNFIKKKNPHLKIIAKIETRQAIENIKEIIAASDGIMVARGDLGENFPYEQIPFLQEKIVTETKNSGKLVIVATQMLESLLTHPRPKRPEVTDVAMATRAQVDSVMLSGETATGNYPLKAIKVMHNIIKETERRNWKSKDLHIYEGKEIIFPVIKQGLKLAKDISAKYVIAITTRGKSPRILASLRPDTLCIVACHHQQTFEYSHLYYAISPILLGKSIKKEEELPFVINNIKNRRKNQNVVFVYGYPFKVNPTNTIRWFKIS